jgi:hypothetical protein
LIINLQSFNIQIMQNIESEVMEAYCDCRLPWEEAANRRNLGFKASAPVGRDEAAKIASKAIPGGYNAFEAELLAKLPKESQITFAREGSVCVYVTPPVREIKAMGADEWDTDNGVTRIWWD